MEADRVPVSDRYQNVEDFVEARRREFPALHPTPPPEPVEGTGRLEDIYDYYYRPLGTAEHDVDVKALRIERSAPPHLIAYLDVPVDRELLEHLRSLSRGARVTVSGIGHGPTHHTLLIYPVHRVNGRPTAFVGSSS